MKLTKEQVLLKFEQLELIVFTDDNHYKFTDKAKLILDIDSTEKENVINLSTGKIAYSDLHTKEFLAWCKKWNDIFPTRKILKDWTNLRVNRNLRESLTGKYGVESKLKKWFIETKFKYPLIVVEYATLRYLNNEWTKDLLRYAKTSGNFVNKQHEPSKLTAECEEIMSLIEDGEITLDDIHKSINNIQVDSEEITSIGINDEEDFWTFAHHKSE